MNRHEKERENGKHQGENIWDLYDSHRKQWIINLMPSKENKWTLLYSNGKLSGRVSHLMDD